MISNIGQFFHFIHPIFPIPKLPFGNGFEVRRQHSSHDEVLLISAHTIHINKAIRPEGAGSSRVHKNTTTKRDRTAVTATFEERHIHLTLIFIRRLAAFWKYDHRIAHLLKSKSRGYFNILYSIAEDVSIVIYCRVDKPVSKPVVISRLRRWCFGDEDG